MVERSIGFGIIGTGMVARYHAQAIAAVHGAGLVAVCRGDSGRSAEAEAQFGVPCDPDLAALLARPEIDAVAICTPSGMHAQQALAAARAGKHVLVEKPMALTLADADAMIAACRNAGVLLGVVLQRRAMPLFQSIREALLAGAFGRPVLGGIVMPYSRPQSYYDSAPWRGTWAQDGGGVLMNQGIHLLDLLLWLLGDVEEVYAAAATLAHSIEVEDSAGATLRFAGGAIGSIAATTAAEPGYPHRVEIYGSAGGVQIEGEGIARWESAVAANPMPAPQSGQGASAAGAGASPGGISAEGHTRIVADFVDAVRQGRPPLVPGEEGRRSLALVLAIYEAARSGGAARPG